MQSNMYVNSDGEKQIITLETNYNILVVGIGHAHALALIQELQTQNKTFNIIGYVVAELLNEDGTVKSTENKSNKYSDQLKNLPEFTWSEIENGNKSNKQFIITSNGVNYTVDALLIESEMLYLVPTARRCIKLMGLPFHMDKPSGINDEYLSMIEEAKKDNIPFQLGYVLRDVPSVFIIKNLIEKGYLGDIVRIECRMNTDLEDKKRNDFYKYPNGSMFIYGSHLLDFILSIMGVPNSMYSFKSQSNFAGHDSSNYPIITTDDNSFAVLTYDNCIATIEVNQVDASGYVKRYISLIGSKATIFIDPFEGASEIRYYERSEEDVYNLNKKYKSLSLAKPDFSIINPNDGDKYYYGGRRYQYLARNFSFFINNFKAKTEEDKIELLFDVNYDYESTLHKLLMGLCKC